MNKLIISSETLKPALSKLGQAIGSNTALPILGNLYFRITPGFVDIIASNIEITLFYRINDPTAKEAFSFLVPFEFVNKIVAINRHCPLEFNLGKVLKIKGPNDTYDIKASDKVEDYPKIPEVPTANNFDIDNALLSTLKVALVTTSKPGGRYPHVLMELAPGKITIASTDGSYMCFSKELQSTQQEKEELLLSHKVIKVLEGSDSAKLSYDKERIAFESGCITIINTRSTDKFPNFRAIFPIEWPGNLTISKHELLEALGKCSLSKDPFMTTRLDFDIPNEIRFSATDDFIDINVSIQGEYTGPVKYTAVGSDKLLQLLNQVEYSEITLAIHDSRRSIVVTSTEDEGYKALLMPLAIN